MLEIFPDFFEILLNPATLIEERPCIPFRDEVDSWYAWGITSVMTISPYLKLESTSFEVSKIGWLSGSTLTFDFFFEFF